MRVLVRLQNLPPRLPSRLQRIWNLDIYPKSVEQYEQSALEHPKQANLSENQNIKTCLVEHEKHDFVYLYHGTESLEEITGGSDEYQEIDLSAD